MGVKLGKSAFPSGHGPNDFECFPPPATVDGEFATAKIADFGCFQQGDVDSNKYYHAAVVQSTKTKKWYAYFEWGRVGAGSPQFQFVECSDEADAQEEFIDQCRSKNDKRGMWTTIGSLRTLQPKPGKDCYLVRPMASRNVGLPHGKTIKINAGAKSAPLVPAAPAADTGKKGKKGAIAAPAPSTAKPIDHQTLALMSDLNVATVKYAQNTLVGGATPSQASIDQARELLLEATKVVGKVGDNVDAQVNNKDLVLITSQLYSRIPKIKPVGAAASTWILSQNNIQTWGQDLDAYEAALNTATPAPANQPQHDPFNGMKLDMEWIDPNSELGKFIYGWWPDGSGDRHAHVGKMRIRNIWRVSRHDDGQKVHKWQQRVLDDGVPISDRPPYQPKERIDFAGEGIKRCKDTNTALMFHGTRTVNVSGILRESWRLPRQLVGVAINGAAFGPGVYWADDWRKSDGYTSRAGSYYNKGSGGISSRGAFMFAADVVLGNPWLCKTSGGYTAPKPGPKGEKTHVIFAKAKYCDYIANNEWICFDRDQFAMRYLCEYDTGNGRY
jgi:predicted DNA-binding WGR domain protein